MSNHSIESHIFRLKTDPWKNFQFFTPQFCLFETLRVYQGKIRSLPAHMARLSSSAELLKIPFNIDISTQTLLQCLESIPKPQNCALRYSIDSKGNDYLTWRHIPPEYVNCDIDTAMVYATQIPKYGRHYKHSQRMAWIEMSRQLKVKEVIFCDAQDHLLESNQSNLFAIKGTQVITPAFDTNFLPGITRQLLINFLKKQGIQVLYQPIYVNMKYDTLLLTSTLKEISWVKTLRVRGQTMSFEKPPIVTKWQTLFHQYLQSQSRSILLDES